MFRLHCHVGLFEGLWFSDDGYVYIIIIIIIIIISVIMILFLLLLLSLLPILLSLAFQFFCRFWSTSLWFYYRFAFIVPLKFNVTSLWKAVHWFAKQIKGPVFIWSSHLTLLGQLQESFLLLLLSGVLLERSGISITLLCNLQEKWVSDDDR